MALAMFDPRAEGMSADERHAVQGHRLRDLIDRLLAADGVQAERLRAAGVNAGAAVGMRDLPNLPTTDKQDLWDHYPFGMLAVPVRTSLRCTAAAARAGGRPSSVTRVRTWTSGARWSRARSAVQARPRARSCTTRTATACSPVASASTSAASGSA